MKRVFGAVLSVIGAVLAILNLAYLPSVIEVHHGEAVVVAFHVGVVLVGVVLAIAGWRLARGGRAR